ncbi:hypothetical protein F5Y17DRAFT_453069 [Xylariaceae sp. FL0594]|nr:hypothetical protein F5Y17DRAFT_453069 [Xylariaceae sp. FL0594]
MAKMTSSHHLHKALPLVPKPTSKFKTWWWWWEISAAMLSILGSLSIVVLLLKIDGTSLNSWTLPIQPNSFLAALTTITKTSILVSVTSCLGQLKWRHFLQRPRPLTHLQFFDDASRGPWGSIVMLSRLLFREHVWTAVATGLSICNILALGIDPTAQQLIALVPKDIRVFNSSVVVSRAGSYYSRAWDSPPPNLTTPDAAAAYLTFVAPGVEILSQKERLHMQSNLITIPYNTIANQQQHFFRCPYPAVRCEWDDFSTLGVCTKQWNVTDSVRQNCTTALYSDAGNFTQFTDEDPPSDRYFRGLCDFNVDSKSVDQNLNFGDHELVEPLSLEFWNKPPDKTVRYGDVINSVRVNTSATLGSVWVVKVDNFTESFNGTGYRDFDSFVSEFYWCHQDLEGVTVTDNGLHVRSRSTRPWASAEGQRSNLRNAANTTGEYNSMGYNGDTLVPYGYNLQGEPTYRITVNIYGFMEDVIDRLIGHKLYWDPTANGAFEHLDGPPKGDNVFSSVQKDDDVQAYNDRLADGLTAFMLLPPELGGDNMNATNVAGYMIYSETHFTVRWPWLIALFFEYLLAILLLVITIYITRDEPLLKNSVLALLASKLADWRDEHLKMPSPDTPEDWDKAGEKMVMQFHKDADGSLSFRNGGP